MSRMKALVLFITIAVVLSGCSAFFTFNAFSGFSTPPTPVAADYEGSGGLDKLQTDLASPAFVAALTGSPVAGQIETYLYSQFSSGVVSDDQKQAAILYADVYLQTTQGEALVNNVVSTLVNGVSGSSTIHDLLAAIIPTSALDDPTVFSTMVDALLQSWAAYNDLGAGIDRNSNGVLDAGEGVPPGTNMGDVAQKAGVAWSVQVIYNAISGASSGPYTAAQVVDQMYKLAKDPTTADPPVQTLTPTPYTDDGSAGFRDLKILFLCAGIPMPTTT